MTPHSKQRPSERIREIVYELMKHKRDDVRLLETSINAIINYLDEQYEKSQ